jgi:hypothetical protein
VLKPNPLQSRKRFPEVSGVAQRKSTRVGIGHRSDIEFLLFPAVCKATKFTLLGLLPRNVSEAWSEGSAPLTFLVNRIQKGNVRFGSEADISHRGGSLVHSGHSGRKVRVKIGDVEVEAETTAEVESLLAKVEQYRREIAPGGYPEI